VRAVFYELPVNLSAFLPEAQGPPPDHRFGVSESPLAPMPASGRFFFQICLLRYIIVDFRPPKLFPKERGDLQAMWKRNGFNWLALPSAARITFVVCLCVGLFAGLRFAFLILAR